MSISSRARLSSIVASLVGGLSVTASQQPTPFTGAGVCATCHARIFARQSHSAHAQALRPVLQTNLPDLFNRTKLSERGGYVFTYKSVPTGLLATASNARDSSSIVLEWVFGSGSQGMTPVGRFADSGSYVEHRISWYANPGKPGITVGHINAPSLDARFALGREQNANTAYRCFNCHATHVDDTPSGPDLSGMEPGVKCERCHGPGGAHVAAARSNNPTAARKLILNPGNWDTRALVATCAECHRSSGATSSLSPDMADPVTVRFQPIRLFASKCFQKSKSLSCLTCHDPHANASREDPEFYSAKCRSCHAGTVASKCPRKSGGSNCIRCHMQQSTPLPHLWFTDHNITVPDVG